MSLYLQYVQQWQAIEVTKISYLVEYIYVIIWLYNWTAIDSPSRLNGSDAKGSTTDTAIYTI